MNNQYFAELTFSYPNFPQEIGCISEYYANIHKTCVGKVTEDDIGFFLAYYAKTFYPEVSFADFEEYFYNNLD
jgi:hypothetical protein